MATVSGEVSSGVVDVPKRWKREDLRDLIVDAGVSMLLEEGLGQGAEALTYADVFRRFEAETGMKVSRAQVHGRIWDSVEEFREAVLAYLGSYDSALSGGATADAATGILPGRDLEGEEERWQVIREMFRAGSSVMSTFTHNLVAWEMYSAVWGLQSVENRTGRASDQIVEAVTLSETNAHNRFHNLYRSLGELCNVGVRPELNLDVEQAYGIFTALCGSYSEGVGVRWGFDPNPLDNIGVGSGLGGEVETWNAYGLGWYGFARWFFTPMPSTTTAELPDVLPIVDHPLRDVGLNLPHRPTQPMLREELEQRLILTGATLLNEDGLGHGAGALTYARVFERIEADSGYKVNRAQVHGRIWESLEDYQLDVLERLAAVDTFEFREKMLQELGDLLDLVEGPIDRQFVSDTVREMCRTEEMSMTSSIEWHIWSALSRLHVLGKVRPARIERNIALVYADGQSQWSAFFQKLIRMFDYRVRPALQLETPAACGLFAQMTDALSEGVAKHRILEGPYNGDIVLRTGPNGEEQKWELFGIGFLALVDLFFEPIPASD